MIVSGADYMVLAVSRFKRTAPAAWPLFVEQQLDGRGELDDGDLLGVGADLIAQGAHDLGPRIVPRRVQIRLRAGSPPWM